MSRLRVVFCGTPQFAVPSLKKLLSLPEFDILGVFTQPDRPRGRGNEVSFSPVKGVALAAGVPVHQPEKIRAPEIEQQLRSVGARRRSSLLRTGRLFRGGCCRFRGWAGSIFTLRCCRSIAGPRRFIGPLRTARASTGNTTMRIDAGMDTGEMLLQQELTIGPDETAPEVMARRLSEAGAGLMMETLRGLAAGKLTSGAAGYCAGELCADFEAGGRDESIGSGAALEIYNRMRGFTPWPGAYTEFRGQTCHVWGKPFEARANDRGAECARASAGNAMDGRGKIAGGVRSSNRNGANARQTRGTKTVSAAGEFANGARLQAGERFGKS